MKIFSTEPSGNEVAEYVGTDYLKFSIKTIEETVEWLKGAKIAAQPLLAHIEMLLIISKKYRVDANLLIEKPRVQEWKSTFYDWFDRCGGKIPAKYRDGIKQSADELFAELDTFGH
ncbi:MAG: hypothetical protein P8P74_05565 [Crocinitomicaceae bacterium]|nr:hypothetical protein [Crocinitomicaceae bacterium]